MDPTSSGKKRENIDGEGYKCQGARKFVSFDSQLFVMLLQFHRVPHNMHLFTFVQVVGLLFTVSETSAQYYYVSAGQPALFQFRNNYNSFPQQFPTVHGNQQFSTVHGSQQFSSVHGNQQFSTVHGNQGFSTFHGNQQFPSIHGNQQFQRFQAPVVQQPAYIPHANPVAPVQRQPKSSVGDNDAPEYRGFAYQTVSDNNAVSHVLFVSGPDSQKFTSRVFSSMTSQGADSNTAVESGRSVASDLVDPLKHAEYDMRGEDYMFPKNTENAYSPHTFDFAKPENSFHNFFHNPRSFANVINFYSSPKSGLFAQQVSGYPASTGPLQAPFTSPVFGTLQTSLDTMSSTTTEAASVANDDDTVVIDNAEGQESILVKTRFRLNEVTENMGKSLKTSNDKPAFNEQISTLEKDMVTEKTDYVEDISTSGEEFTKPFESIRIIAPTTEFLLIVTENNTPDSTTNMMPTGVTEKTVTTMDQPDETTVTSVHTTNESVEILDKFTQTTSQSIETTSQSAQIMEKSVQTTVQTIQTTDQIAQTTDQSVQPTVQSTEITSQSAQTTEQSIKTTGLFENTTDQSRETTEQTTEMAGTTVINSDKGTVTTDDLATTAGVTTTTTV